MPIDQPALLYYLGSLGKSLSKKGSAGDLLGEAVMKSASAQAMESQLRAQEKKNSGFNEQLQELISGGKAKVSIDDKGFKLHVLSEKARSKGSSSKGPDTASPDNTAQAAVPDVASALMGEEARPSVAGLSPGDLANVMQLGQAKQALMQRTVMDIIQANQRQQQLQAAEEQAAFARSQAEEENSINRQKLSIERAKLDIARNKTDAPTSVKEYAAAKADGFEGNYTDFLLLGKNKPANSIQEYELAKKEGFKGNFADFKNIYGTAAISNYEYAVSQGYEGTFEDWQKQMAQAGATNITIGPEERARGTAAGKQKEDFKSPEYVDSVKKSILPSYEYKSGSIPEEKISQYTDSYWNKIGADLESRFGAGNVSVVGRSVNGVTFRVVNGDKTEDYTFPNPDFKAE